MSNDRDDRTEDALRRALSAQAGQVSPGGDGLMKIQQRVAARDARMRWLRPALAGGVAVVVIAAGVGGYAIARNNGGGNASVQVGNSTSPTPHDVAADGFPTQAFFPFSTATEESSWEQQYAGGHSPWISDPVDVSTFWMENYLNQSSSGVLVAKVVNGAEATVTLGRHIAGSSVKHPVAVIHLVQYRNAWLITGVDAPGYSAITIASPAPGASVTSPLTVSGPGFGVDERATVEVRDGELGTLLGQAMTDMFGNGTPQWSASPSFTPSSDGVGVVVVTVASAADGGLGQLAAEKVTFGASGHAVAASDAYAVEGGALVTLNPTTGASEGPVADSGSYPPIGNGQAPTVAEVQQVGGSIYFSWGQKDCPIELRSLPVEGGASRVVATADSGYGITGFDVAASGRLVYFESGCGNKGGTGALVFPQWAHGPAGHEISFPSLPPLVVGDPVWESDGVHVDAFVRTGNMGYLGRYDSGSGDNPQPNANACPGFDIEGGLPNAVAEGPDGALWVASQTGTSMQVVSCTGSKPTAEFTVNGNDTPQSLAVSSSGEVLLVGAVSGKVWSWSPGTTSPRALSEASGVTSIAW